MKNADALPASFGPYHVLETLTRGAMGAVHLARHETTGELAILKTPRTDHAHASRALANEIDALSRLRHPNIVRMREHGEAWLALDPAPGDTLPIDHTDAPSVEAKLRPFVGLCHALAYLHGEGWVHADLSPRNVMVDEGGTSTLLDFGLATRFGHRFGTEDLERAGMLAGTLAYVSPEQLRGMPLDARSDVYGLGCLLYASLTGAPPFHGSRDAIVHGHLHRRPARLPQSVPRSLASVLMRMLSREPARRPGHVHALLDALVACGAPAALPASPPRAYLTQPPMIGRDEGIDAWQSALDQGIPQRWALVGEAGMGKSRAAFSMIRRARTAGLDVLTTPDALAMLSTHDARTLLVFDDVDPDTALLSALADRASCWVLACSREGVERSQWDHVWELDALDSDEVHALVRSALGGLEVPDALEEFLAERGRGNPWMTLEYLSALLDEELVTFRQDGTYRFELPPGTLRARLSELSTPTALTQVLAGRIARMPKSWREACLLLAVAARPLSRADLEVIPGLDLEGLAHVGWVRERAEGVVLHHSALGEAALSHSTQQERARWHRHLLERDDLRPGERARHLEGIGDMEGAFAAYRRAGELALEESDLHDALLHLRSARRLTRDARVRFELGARIVEDILLAHMRQEETRELLEDMRADAPEDLLATWHLLRSFMLNRSRAFDEALEELVRARASSAPDDDFLRARQHKTRGDVLDRMGRYPEALPEHTAAVEVFRRLGEVRLLADTLHNRSLVHAHMGDPAAGVEDAREALALYESITRHDRVALARHTLGNQLRKLWRFDEALALHRDARAYHQRIGSFTLEAYQQFAEACCLMDAGQMGAAQRMFREVEARQSSAGSARSGAHYFLGHIALARLDLDAARAHLASSKRLREVVEQNRRVEFQILGAHIQALEGDPEGALRALDLAQRAIEGVLPFYLDFGFAFLKARLLYLNGAHERTLELARERSAELVRRGAAPRSLQFAWLAALAHVERGALTPLMLDELRALGGHHEVMDVRVELLAARWHLERGELDEARASMDLAHEVCEVGEAALERLTLWRLEVMMARARGESPDFALEELESALHAAPRGLPERAWWPLRTDEHPP